MSVVIETERLRLRHQTLDDAPFILELVTDPDWIRFIADSGVKDIKGAKDFIAKGSLAAYARQGFGLYLVERRADSLPLGLCGLIKRDFLEDIDLGFAFLPAYRGQGYAFEAAGASLRYGFETLGYDRILAITLPDNTSSIKLLEKLGMREQGIVMLKGEELLLFGIERAAD